MKTVIVYESTHHGNTKKLVDAIAEKCGVDTVSVENAAKINFAEYDTIGIAAGIAYGKFYKATEKFAAETLPEGKNVFFIYTCGMDSGKYANHISAAAKSRQCTVLGVYGCQGYDTFGPFGLIGGVAKGHPTQEEIDGSVAFYGNLTK